MRKAIILSLIIAIVFTLLIAPLSAYASDDDSYVYLVMHNNTRLYQFPNITERENLKGTLSQGTVVERLDDIEYNSIPSDIYSFYKVNANGKVGYVLINDIYRARADYVYDIVYKKIKSNSLYNNVMVYEYPDSESTVLTILRDGEKVSVLKTDFSYNGFEKILYKEGYAYVESSNLTSGLSKNQQVALIIVSIVTLFIALTSLLLIKAHKKVN